MQPLPEEMLVPMVGVIVGLVIFAGLLQLGVFIVRRLGLPNELPEGPHFEPPPPASRDVLERSEAIRIAARQAELRQRYAHAREAAQAAQLCAELAAQTYPAVTGAPEPLTVKADLARLADAAKISAAAAEQAARSPDVTVTVADCKALAAEAIAAAKAAEVLASKFPSGRDRRLRLMAVVLIIVVIWWILMFVLMPHR